MLLINHIPFVMLIFELFKGVFEFDTSETSMAVGANAYWSASSEEITSCNV